MEAQGLVNSRVDLVNAGHKLRVDPVTLSRNVAFKIVKEKTPSDLLKTMLNMYEKLSNKTTRKMNSKVNGRLLKCVTTEWVRKL